ncbi:MAG: ABC transporter ATP-binding protein/permease [Lachnospiraceae bacterium]|nr:ABC transporter ATP-binding protein/permease [Lachnospiraceae bacterium]
MVKKLIKLLRGSAAFVVLSFLCAGASSVLALVIPKITGNAIDLIIGKGNVDFAGIKSELFKALVIILITAGFQWIMNVINNRIVYKLVQDVRVRAFNKIHSLPLSYLDSHRSGETLNRIIADTDQLAEGLLLGFTQAFTGIITIILALVFMGTISIKIMLLVVCITPLSLFIASFIGKHTYSMFHAQSVAKADVTSHVNEMVTNQKLVHAFAYENKASEQFDEYNKKLCDTSLKATFYSSIVNPTTRFVNAIVSGVVVLAGGFGVLRGVMSVGGLSAFIAYSNQYTKPFNEISGVITELQNSLACAARVFELIEEAEEVAESKDANIIEEPRMAIDFANVNFSYLPEKPLIENLNLHILPGQKVAIVGPTGCGKTTLINLIMRFYDVKEGRITFDSVDIKDATRASLRSNIGMVLQDTWLKAGTIRENIVYGKPDATDEEIIAAAKAAHAHSFIKRLPKGYDTFIGEDGGLLSAGQKQLLCITRVMLSLPPVLILDEATSSIDTRTEIRIQKAFNKMMEGRTSFIVAHRLSTIKEADLIIVMKDGKVIETGTHESLLSARGFYADLFNAQFAR